MWDVLKDDFLSLILYIVVSPILGWGIINCLFELLDGLGIKVRKDKKWKCWFYTSLLVLSFAVLIRTFSSI